VGRISRTSVSWVCRLSQQARSSKRSDSCENVLPRVSALLNIYMIFMYIQIVATVSASFAIVRPAVPLANLFVMTLIRHEAFGQCFSGERVLLRPARELHAPEMIF